MRRRRRTERDELAQLRARVRALEARPRLPASSLVPVMTQDEEFEDDKYGIVLNSRAHIGMMMFPENPYDGQHFWLHEPLSGEMYNFIFCHHYGKWVCPTYYQACQSVASFTDLGTSFSTTTQDQVGRITIPNGRALWDIGVSYEVTASADINNGGPAQTSSVRVAWYDWAAGDGGIGTPLRFSSAFSESLAAVSEMCVLDWEQFPDDPNPSGDHFTFAAQTKVTGATGTFSQIQFTVRLVHEPTMEEM